MSSKNNFKILSCHIPFWKKGDQTLPCKYLPHTPLPGSGFEGYDMCVPFSVSTFWSNVVRFWHGWYGCGSGCLQGISDYFAAFPAYCDRDTYSACGYVDSSSFVTILFCYPLVVPILIIWTCQHVHEEVAPAVVDICIVSRCCTVSLGCLRPRVKHIAPLRTQTFLGPYAGCDLAILSWALGRRRMSWSCCWLSSSCVRSKSK